MPRTIVGIQPMESRPGIRKRAIKPTIAPKMIQVTIAVRSISGQSFPGEFPPPRGGAEHVPSAAPRRRDVFVMHHLRLLVTVSGRGGRQDAKGQRGPTRHSDSLPVHVAFD